MPCTLLCFSKKREMTIKEYKKYFNVFKTSNNQFAKKYSIIYKAGELDFKT